MVGVLAGAQMTYCTYIHKMFPNTKPTCPYSTVQYNTIKQYFVFQGFVNNLNDAWQSHNDEQIDRQMLFLLFFT